VHLGGLDASRSSGDLEHVLFQDENDTAAAAHFDLGMTLYRQRNLSAAAASLRRAVELQHQQDDGANDNDTSNDEAKFQLAKVLTDMGYVDEAVRLLRELVANGQEEDDPCSRARLALANVLLDGRGERAAALEVYRQCCSSENKPSPMALLAGVAADSMGDHAAAEVYYQASLGSAKEEHADADTALHLMTSRIRRNGDPVGIATLRGRLPDHVASSVDYVLSTPVGLRPSMHYFTYDMLQLALENASLEEGLILEFGVYHGKTIRMIASHFPNATVHGFDTFSGIPEEWHHTPSGSYSTHGSLPQAPDTVQYHVGLFSETLPEFLETAAAPPGKPIRLMNIDCDLYSSTKDVLDALSDRVVPGTIIIFDEYVINPHWKEDEHRAFQEAVVKYGWKYEYLGISLVSQQAVVRIL